MQGKVHVAIGTASLALFCVKYPNGFEFANTHIIPAIGLVTATFGSYLPDIDQSRTHMGQKHKIVSKVVNKTGGGHRGITHTLLFPVIIAALMIFASSYLAEYPTLRSLTFSLLFGVEFGYVMHIFADLFNGKGCPLLWPFMKGKVHIADLPSSGVVPWLFAIVLVIAEAFFMFGGLL